MKPRPQGRSGTPRSSRHGPAKHKKRPSPGPRGGSFRSDYDPDGPLHLYGLHAVEAALRNPKRALRRILMTENAENRLQSVVAERQIAPERVSPRDLDRMLGADTVHQGVLLETEPLEEPSLADLAAKADTAGPIVLLDQVTDPHNVGAILRSCAVFDAAGLVMTRRHSPPLDATLAKSASGALELVDVALVQNLARAIDELKEQAFTVLGLDGEAPTLIEEETYAGRVALVLGAEGKGLRELTRQSCDRLVRIGAPGPLASLNVSNAAAVALHASARRRRQS